MKINKDLVAASATPIILSILRDGESYGYAIIQKVRDLSDGELVWSDGMLYPILHRLEEQRLIEARWGESETGRKRKYYRIQNSAKALMEDERRQWNVVNLLLTRLAQPEAA